MDTSDCKVRLGRGICFSMKKKGILIGLPILVAALTFTFYRMGGFREIELEVLENPQIELSGLRFVDIPQDKQLRESFEQMEQVLQQHPEARLHTIYFREPAGKLDTMEVFVGIEKKWLTAALPGFENLNLSAPQAAVAKIHRHRFVMPNPETVKASLRDFAKANKLPEPTLFIDQIVNPEEVRVIGIKPEID